MPKTILVSGMFRCKFKHRPVLRAPYNVYMLACLLFLLLRTYYYIVYTVCYWSCLCCYRMLPSVKTYINHSFGQQEKKYSNSNNKIKHFRMGTIASRVRVWVSVCVCARSELNTHKHSPYICVLSNTFRMSFESLWTIHGPWTMDNWDCP